MSPVGRSHKARIALSVAAAATVALSVAACGSSNDAAEKVARTTKATPCPGKPLVIGQITSLEGLNPNPTIADGVRTGFEQVNFDCSVGRPIKYVFCNDHGDPSRGADCGRDMVKRKAIAIVGSGGAKASSYEPIIHNARIPTIANVATDPTEQLADTSFPFYNGLSRIGAYAAVIKGAGAKNVSVILPNNPALRSVLPSFRDTAGLFGLKIDRFVLVPTDATDLAQYASQAAKSAGIMILMDSKAEGLLREFINSGITPQNRVITSPALPQDEIDEIGLGDKVNGLLSAAPVVPMSDTSNPGVIQYLKESDYAGASHRGVDGMIGWRGAHVTADVIKSLNNPTPASLVEAMSKYRFSYPEAAPVDFTKPAFPEISSFDGFRIFAREFAVWRVDNQKFQLVGDGFVDPSDQLDLK